MVFLCNLVCVYVRIEYDSINNIVFNKLTYNNKNILVCTKKINKSEIYDTE